MDGEDGDHARKRWIEVVSKSNKTSRAPFDHEWYDEVVKIRSRTEMRSKRQSFVRFFTSS